ncbi:heavy metal translocating P-type ATPase [Leucobacter sp. M11]|uniref:heavy metal translocating P-type ATPase n=1 Tax=Leucobacter sp. M11 TaxID=2993565 RepID=UPI002D7F57C4|nr:heavy metal translocating P-type ATPase [Leucobacter sp. M11]MEB4614070.1 heavy metal translocating P-type ATPase [Leucobacter sp. M11]
MNEHRGPQHQQHDPPVGQAHSAREQQAGHSDHADHTHEHTPAEHGGHTDHTAHAAVAEHAGHDEHAGHGGHDEHAGHGGHEGHVALYRRLFWVMLGLAIPTVLLSPMFASIVGYPLPDAGLWHWISPVLGTVMYVWGGRPFLTGAVDEIRARKPGMMLLIALAITVAFLASWGSTLGILDHQLDFWWELALLVVIMLLGHWIEMRSLAQTSSALDSLAALLPDTAVRVEGEELVEVSPAELRVGDRVLVRPGDRVPADGRVVEGSASFDESMITGESRTVRRGPGDSVVAGTVATDSGVRIDVTATGEGTALAGIRRLVDDAQNSSTNTQRLADRAAGWLFWFALGSAAITALVWLILGRPDDAVVRTITVLVIACPHALGLAIPLVVSIATERAAKAGVLVKDRLALERMREVDAVLFDKTGTLTVGKPTVLEVAPVAGVSEDEVLALAAAAEGDSEHPLATAITGAAARQGLAVPASSHFEASPAEGVSATVEGATIAVGGPHLLDRHGVTELDAAEPWRAEGAIILHVLRDGAVIGALKLADEIRPESLAAVEALHARKASVVMITGDAEAVAQSVAAELGIDRVFAGVRPEDKAAKVRELQAEGRTVAMVGDGVNDAPALAQADVGIAIGAGTDVAIGSAGIILASDDPRAVLSITELSEQSTRKMRQNLWWAAGYNLLSVPLAAGVLAPIGFVLPMSVGAVLMSLSTVIVALNAQLLRRLDLSPDTLAPTRAPRNKG